MARNAGSWRRKRSEMMGEGLDDLSPCDSHQVHVLAVDDSLVDRKVIERLLRISSCKVTAVDSGIRALQFLGLDDERGSMGFTGLKVDLIITDYCMPGMTGYELLKKIKGSSNFRQIPVVIMSSENVLARIDRCLEEGAEDFIMKPVKLSDVKRLKDYMFGEEGRAINKRKSPETSELSPPASQPSIPSPSPSSSPSPLSSSPLLSPQSSPPSSSPPTSSIESPSSSPIESPSSSPHTPPPPSPPTPLDSPTRRLKMTCFD
ncbi:hypothetical protein NMG60_11008937 [Bertholletia excelsa]